MPTKILLPILDTPVNPHRIAKHLFKSKSKKHHSNQKQEMISSDTSKAISATQIALIKIQNDKERQVILERANEIRQSLEVEKVYHNIKRYVNEAIETNFEPVYDNKGKLLREYIFNNGKDYISNLRINEYKNGELVRVSRIITSPFMLQSDITEYQDDKFKKYNFHFDNLGSYTKGKIVNGEKVIDEQYRYNTTNNSLYTYYQKVKNSNDTQEDISKMYRFNSKGEVLSYRENITRSTDLD